MVDKMFVRAVVSIVGDQYISFVRSLSISSISCCVRSVAIAIISATSFDFSEHMVHIRLTAPSICRRRKSDQGLLVGDLSSRVVRVGGGIGKGLFVLCHCLQSRTIQFFQSVCQVHVVL